MFKEALALSRQCCQDLGKAEIRCCLLNERSPLFHVALEQLRAANFILQFGPHTSESLAKCGELFEACGGTVGELHGTCCTSLRTDCYSRVRRRINEAIQKVDAVAALLQAAKPEVSP